MVNFPDCNADVTANGLFTSLTADMAAAPAIDLSGFTFTPDPNSVLYETPNSVTLADLTTVSLDGTGAFDSLMRSVDLHIQREFKDNRITGDQYAKVYTEVMSSVLSTSNQFVLNKDQARWAAIAAQMDARVAEIRATEALISLEKTKAETQKMIFEMQNAGAEYGLTKMEIANADAQYCLIKTQTAKEDFTVHKMLPVSLAQEQHKMNFLIPAQTQLVQEQVESQRAQTLDTRSDGLTPIVGLLGKQKESVQLDIDSKQYTLDFTLPIQLDLVKEQREAERAKTLDTRTDNSTVEGSIGKQKDLYDQQIDSFVKDAKHKTAKMYLDGWITQKTLDEALIAPTELQNTAINSVLSSVRAANSL